MALLCHFRQVQPTRGSFKYALMLQDENSHEWWEPEEPAPLVSKDRRGKNSGSGPYYKSVLRPYLADNTVYVPGYGDCIYNGAGGYSYKSSGSTFTELYQLPSSPYPDTGWMGNVGVAVVNQTFNGSWITSLSHNMSYLAFTSDKKFYWHTINVAITSNNGELDYGLNTISFSSTDDALSTLRQVARLGGYDLDTLFSTFLQGTITFRVNFLDGFSVNFQISRSWGAVTPRKVDYPQVKWAYDDPGDEWTNYLSIVDGGIIPAKIRNVVSEAYQNSSASLPEVSANGIANVMQLADMVLGVRKTLKTGGANLIGIGKRMLDPRNAWLSWRYVYNTTKMDINEYKEVTNRLIGLGGSMYFKTNGKASLNEYSAKCTETWLSESFDPEGKSTLELLRTYGLKLSAYNVWDLIPYSFMVDWFIPVGDAIEHMESWNQRRKLISQECWFSISKQLPHGYIYYRWQGVKPTMPPVYTTRKVSDKTLIYRLADTVSIFTD